MGLEKEFEQQGIWLFRYRGQLPVLILVVQLAIYFFAVRDKSLFWNEPGSWEIICLGMVCTTPCHPDWCWV